jgi:hypothetical protein
VIERRSFFWLVLWWSFAEGFDCFAYGRWHFAGSHGIPG